MHTVFHVPTGANATGYPSSELPLTQYWALDFNVYPSSIRFLLKTHVPGSMHMVAVLTSTSVQVWFCSSHSISSWAALFHFWCHLYLSLHHHKRVYQGCFSMHWRLLGCMSKDSLFDFALAHFGLRGHAVQIYNNNNDCCCRRHIHLVMLIKLPPRINWHNCTIMTDQLKQKQFSQDEVWQSN